MQKCLGIYIENNLIKYAKVSKEKNDFKIESFGIRFFDDLSKEIKKIIEETYSFSVPISINLASEKYLYYDIFALLSKADVQKSVQTEFETYCEENKYNSKAFETRYALVPKIEEPDKIKAIQVAVNKIELNKQKQYFEKNNLTRITPIGTSIVSIGKFDKKENALIINMEEKTTITTIYNSQIYDVETLDVGSEEILEKINRVENSMSKAYEICKNTTIYTSTEIEDTEEQPYLEDIIPTLYQISQRMKEIVESAPVKIETVYLTGTLAAVNNVDLYFQEFLTNAECSILKPNIVEATASQLNVKEYIEVNSAISLAMTALGEGSQGLNFKNMSASEKVSNFINTNLNLEINKPSKERRLKLDFSFTGTLTKTEQLLLRAAVAILMLNIVFMIFSKMLYGQIKAKEEDVQFLITSESSEISKIGADTQKLSQINEKYKNNTEKIKANNNRMSNIAGMKDAIPNLLNQIMYAIPEGVQLTSIQNTSDRKIKIEARSAGYDQLGYFFSQIKLEGFLKNASSSGSQKTGGYVSVTIEGDLP